MQTKPIELLYQQIVLKHLGYYSGKLDGIWSAKCRAGKCSFENNPVYVPGLPNRGLPFTIEYLHPLPKGVIKIPNPDGKGSLLSHVSITDSQMKEYLSKSELRSTEVYQAELRANADARNANKTKSAPVPSTEPKAELFVADGPVVEQKAPEPSTNEHNKNNHKNNHNKNRKNS